MPANRCYQLEGKEITRKRRGILVKLNPAVAEIVRSALSILYERITKLDPASVDGKEGVRIKFIGIPLPEWYTQLKKLTANIVAGKSVAESDNLYSQAFFYMLDEENLIKASMSEEDSFITITAKGNAYYEDLLSKSKKVFIVHGHNEAKKWELKNFLSGLGLDPVILHEQDDLSMTIIEKFEYYARKCSFAFVLLTPDDEVAPGTAPSEAKWRARQNVILELGWFMGTLGRQNVVLIHNGPLEIPSDILGIVYLPFDKSILEVSEKIRQRLEGASIL
jgi:hypothetical protein